MTIKQMEYILELSRTRNFNRAAENLFISQPALTYQIQKAEEELGFPLFLRTGKGAGLTVAGERFVGSVAGIVDEYKGAVETGRRISPQYEEAIRIGLPERVAIPRFAKGKEAFQEAYPGTPVLLQYYSADRVTGTDEPGEEADLFLLLRERRGRIRRGWRECCQLGGYIGVELLPEAQDVVVGEGESVVWLPYSAEPVSVLLLQKLDEKREIVQKFVSFFS